MSEPHLGDSAQADDGSYNDGRNVYLVGLGYRTTEEEVREECNKYGRVESCQLVIDPKTRKMIVIMFVLRLEISRCYAFVLLEGREDADAVIRALNGAEALGGRLKASLV